MAEKRPRRPNIVLILADDMGYGDLSCYDPNSKIPTPHLDRLAGEGVRFTDAHAPSALCTPTRYSLLTGRYCWRSRLKSGVLNGYSERLIEPGRMTLPSMLKDQGYHTACVGKWHLGWDWQKRDDGEVDFAKPIVNGPNAVGFDWFFGIAASLDMPPYCYVENDRPTALPDGVIGDSPWDAFWRGGPIAPDFRHADVLPRLAERAVEYIRERGRSDADQPFFLYFPLTAPHTPVLPTEAFRGRSQAGDYGDFCVQVDDVVGAVVQALNETGAADDTLLVFTSDNGPERNAYKRVQEYRHYSMSSWRGLKRDTWEGGHRVPLIVRWGGLAEAGRVSEETVTLTDVMATVAELVGADLPGDAAEDSLSFLPALTGGSIDRSRREAIVYHGAKGDLAIRRGDWVLIDAPSGAGGAPEPEWFRRERGDSTHQLPGELYDLVRDPGQTVNVYAEHPQVVDALRGLLQKIRDEGRSVLR